MKIPTKTDVLNAQVALLRSQGVSLDEIRKALYVLIATVRAELVLRSREATDPAVRCCYLCELQHPLFVGG